MRRLFVVLLLAPAAVALPAAAAHADPTGTGYTLVFEDQFNGTAVDTAPAAKLSVAGTQTVVNGTAGPSGWVDLGTFTLPAGTGTAVTLTGSGTGCARADAVRFVRV